MELKDLICDIEYAKKLAELGVNKDSIYSFTQYSIKSDKNYKWNIILTNVLEKYIGIKTFTTDELLEMLPKVIEENKYLLINPNVTILNINTENEYSGHQVGYSKKYNDDVIWEINFTEKKLENSLAKLLIWCIENNYMKTII